MRHIPVIETIREAYRFTFTHLGAIIGFIWLPMVIVTVAGFFIEQRYYADAQTALAANDVATMGPAMLGLVFYMVAALLLYAMMYVPVAQLALGLRQGGTVARLSFGPLEWRMFRSILGLILFLFMPLLVLAIVANIVLPTDAAAFSKPQVLLAQTAFLVIYCGMIFVGLRFAFLLPAIVVAEDKPPLARSWALSAGNFWRILAIVLGAVGPVVILAAIVQVLLEGATTMPQLSTAPGGMALAMHAARSNLPLAAGIGFLIAPFLLGLGVGASAFAYRELARPM